MSVGTHDNVWAWLVDALAGGLALFLPDPLHGQTTKLDSFRGSCCRCANGLLAARGMPHVGENGDASSVYNFWDCETIKGD